MILLALSATAAVSQSAAEIAAIRSEVAAINKNSAKYRKSTRNVDGISLEGASATYFTSGRGLKKIMAKIFGETFRATAEIYYSGEEMIFAYQRLERYDTQIAMDPPPKVIKIMETRVYFAGGKAIRVIEGKKLLSPSDSEFRAAEEGMQDLSGKLKDAFDP